MPMSPQRPPPKPTFPDSASPSSPIFSATRTKHSLNSLPRFADHFPCLAHNGPMICDRAIDDRMIHDETRTAPSLSPVNGPRFTIHDPLPAFQLAAFLTTNRYPRITASPVPLLSTADHYSPTTESPAFLTTNHYPLTTAFDPPPMPLAPTPLCRRPHPPIRFCETVKLWSL